MVSHDAVAENCKYSATRAGLMLGTSISGRRTRVAFESEREVSTLGSGKTSSKMPMVWGALFVTDEGGGDA